MIGQEDLSAYLDGEATVERTREIEAALEADPQLRARLDRLQHTDLNVTAAMDSLLERPVPDRLADAVRAKIAAHEPKPTNDNVALTPRAGWRDRAVWPSAIAAALVAGVMLGHFAPLGRAQPGDWTIPAGASAPQAGQAMAAALGDARSGAHVTLASGHTLTPVMTFASQDGGLCRQFDLAGAGARQSGVACRSDGKAWRLVALTPAAPALSSAGGGYQTAAGPGEDPVSALAGKLIKGEPMDATAEAAALHRR